MKSSNVRFEVSQRGPIMLVMMCIGIVVLLLLAWLDPLRWWIGLGIAAVLLAIGFAFRRLTITVTDREVIARFGLGFVGRTVPLDQILAVKAVRNCWWYGFGVRWTPHGWLLNVGGLDAIELTRRGMRPLRLGTDRPTELAAAIEAAVAAR